MKKLTMICCMAVALVAAVGCCGSSTCTQTTNNTEMKKYAKKYTNADFYKDGVFQEDVAKKAYLDMFEFYGYPMTPFLEANFWVAEFGIGDFENCGMGGVFWLNDAENGYFAHDIYLLPDQMVPEHKHVETEHPAKIESWMVQHGWVYNFSEVGEPIADAEQVIPASQLPTTVSRHYVKQTIDGIVHLKDAGAETWHSLIAGPEGAIVHEYANYHDGAGLRFTNPKSKM